MFLGLDLEYVNEVHWAPDEGIACVPGDRVIARTVRAKEIARVIQLRNEAPLPFDENAFVKKILRKAEDKDFQREDENRQRESKAFLIAEKKIERLALPMKLIRVHYLFDHSRIIFFFKAANKVDFRQLVRDLAAVFKTRIELRQIGVRDEAKILGGTGSCGRELCCATFLRSFEPVTVKMAKLQHHTVNPSKISGQCGRLKCCIAYECPHYDEALRGVPPLGAEVCAAHAVGRVVKLNVFTCRAEVLKDDGSSVEVTFDEIRHCRYVHVETDATTVDEDRLLDAELADNPAVLGSSLPPPDKRRRAGGLSTGRAASALRSGIHLRQPGQAVQYQSMAAVPRPQLRDANAPQGSPAQPDAPPSGAAAPDDPGSTPVPGPASPAPDAGSPAPAAAASPAQQAAPTARRDADGSDTGASREGSDQPERGPEGERS